MVKIRKAILDVSRWDLKCPFPMTPQFIVIHNTANDAPAENEIAYMGRNMSEVSFHYAVDDREAVQGIPETRNAWHAGDGGTGIANRRGIAIEICYSKSGGERFDLAEKNAASLAADILRRYGWGIEKVRKHQDFNGKNCPHRTLERGWERFLGMVQAELTGTEAEKPRYAVGKVYVLRVDALSVRVSPGVDSRRKGFSELTPNAKAHAHPSGHLKKGTAVTCLETRTLGKDIWMRIPSGWVAAVYEGEEYVN